MDWIHDQSCLRVPLALSWQRASDQLVSEHWARSSVCESSGSCFLYAWSWLASVSQSVDRYILSPLVAHCKSAFRSFTKERLPSGHSASKPRLVECLSDIRPFWKCLAVLQRSRSHMNSPICTHDLLGSARVTIEFWAVSLRLFSPAVLDCMVGQPATGGVLTVKKTLPFQDDVDLVALRNLQDSFFCLRPRNWGIWNIFSPCHSEGLRADWWEIEQNETGYDLEVPNNLTYICKCSVAF